MSESYEDDQKRLGGRLRALRKAAGLTGVGAAGKTEMSQPKVSKIETGALLPSVDDVGKLLALYGAPTTERDELLEVARSLHTSAESARALTRGGPVRRQRQIAEIEAEAALVRTFEVAVIPWLLQTAEYARRVAARSDPGEVARMATAREDRQRRLYDGSTTFTFALMENALRARAGPADVMRAQLYHIASLSTLATVELGVIPQSAELHHVPLHGFDVYDDRLVAVRLETSTVTFTDPRDIARYVELFDEVCGLAVIGDDARALVTRIAAELT
jgi:transcriptional regulator with XRE-family HTH domain